MSRGLRAFIVAALLAAATMASATEPLPKALRHAEAVEGMDLYNYRTTLAGRPLSNIEGVWRTTTDGGLFAIIRDDAQPLLYKLIVVDAGSHHIKAGTVMGVASALAADNSYDAQIYTSHNRKGTLSKPKRFTLVLRDDNRLIIKPASEKLSINILRLIPYMGRMSVIKKSNRPDDLDGALRVYPESEAFRDGPVWL